MRALLRALPLLLLSLAVQAAEVDRRIAVTIDDLPWARVDEIVPADLQARHAALMAQLRQAHVPVVGFVNENKLEVDGQVQPARLGRVMRCPGALPARGFRRGVIRTVVSAVEDHVQAQRDAGHDDEHVRQIEHG